MRRRFRVPELGGARAAILHRPHATVTSLTRQLTAIGLRVSDHWPELPGSALGSDYVFFDADMGHDGQFPWPPGMAPMPLIALIGSEAPGRIEWALAAGAVAQILKPVGDHGVYSALLIARQAFEERRALWAEIDGLTRRVAERQTVVKAVTLLATRGKDENQAYDQLRRMAMAWRVNIEEAAGRIVADGSAGEEPDGRSKPL